MRRIGAKLRNLFFRGRAEREMNREMHAHLALLSDNYERGGLAPAEARCAARRDLGVEQAKELHRAERSVFWLEQLFQDIRHAYRGLRKSPGFAAVALLSLAFGIGANTAIFTLVNGILVKTLPVADAHRIVQVRAHLKEFDSSGFSFPVFREMSRQTAIFSQVVAFAARRAVLDWNGVPQKIDLQLVTGSFFPFFGGRPAVGRLIDEDDDRVEGAHPVCVLSDAAWRHYFSADPLVVGRTIYVDGIPLQVIGVVDPGFAGAELQRRYDIWAPTALSADLAHNPRETPNYIWIRILGRLRPGISFAEAQARLQSASRAIEDVLPKRRANANAVYQIRDASRGYDTWRSTLEQPLAILMGSVLLVLLVACANLANLLLARAGERRQEFAIKLSLGISRGRLLRQLLLESLLLAFSGGAAGFLLSVGLTRFLLDLFNAGQQYQTLHVSPDATVLLFTFGGCVLTALLAGLYPAWQASRTDASPGLKAAHALHRGWVRRSLILVQVTLAVVLLFGASLFTHSLRKLKTIDLGYDIDHVLTVQVEQRGSSKVRRRVVADPALGALLTRVRQLPGVQSAAFSNPGVLSGSMMSSDLTVTDNAGQVRHADNVHFLFAGPGYLATLGIPLLHGRDFTAADRQGVPPAAIINQRLAAQLFPGQDPIGRRIDGWGMKNIEIVGVVGNSKYSNVREKTRAIAYQAFDQVPVTGGALEIRCRGALGQVERQVREIVKTAAPNYQVSDVASMELLRDNLIAQDRLLAFLSTLFGVLGTLLALVGIYGLIAYSVTRRTREIGIRVSIGAQRGDVLWLFLREATVLLACGVLLGLPLALALARTLQKMLYEVSTSDPVGVWATVLLLTLSGMAASFLPARRATRINPVEALRYD